MNLKDFLIKFSTVNVEYDILVEKQGFRGGAVRRKKCKFDSPKKNTVCAKNDDSCPLLRTPTLKEIPCIDSYKIGIILY